MGGFKIKHGHAGTHKCKIPSPTYKSWHSMINRCSNKNAPDWYRYGGKGIKVCSRWKDFRKFLLDMGERPANTTLDRINNTKGYYKYNCRWATRKEQAQNRSTNIYFTFRGESKTLPEWARDVGISIPTLKSRLKTFKWPLEKALLEPVRYKAKG